MMYVRILSYVYFVLLTLETLPANSKNTEQYLRLDEENIFLKKRFNDMEVVADEVGRLSEENIQLKNRITKLEKLDDRLEEVAKENLILRREINRLGDICYRLENSFTKQQAVSDIYDKLPQTVTDKTSPKEKTYHTVTGVTGLDHASKENRKGRDAEDLIPDHPKLEQHRQNNGGNLRNVVERLREGWDMEDLIPDHPDLEQHTQNNFKNVVKRLRVGRDMADLVPDHPDLEQHTQSNRENLKNVVKKLREGRDMEDLIPDHTDLEQHTQRSEENLRNVVKRFRGGRDMEDLIPDHPDLEQRTQSNGENFKNVAERLRAGRDFEDLIPDHQDFEQHTQNRDYVKRFREGRDAEDLIPYHQNQERNAQNKIHSDSDSEIYNQYPDGYRNMLQKRLLDGSVHQQSPLVTTKVAFSAFLTSTTGLGSHQAVEYDKVITNVGQGYDPRHGHFIAPVKAVYLLSFTMMNVEGGAVYLEMVKNGVRIAFLFADENDYNSASQVVVTALNVGDMVWVRHALATTGHQLDGEGYNTFSGSILFETD